MKRPYSLLYVTAVFCLAISGMAGLVYEVAWAHYLALFLGHTSFAIVAVLVAFMGGLALGNAWLGARADRSPRPLALYAWLEIGIAAYALVFPSYYVLCQQAFTYLAQTWTPGYTGMQVLKFAFSLLTILLPTILMGGTLPVLIRLVTRSLSELRASVSTLYFINSAGAVAGCWLADFWLIPEWGLQSTVWAGAAMNLFAGLVALFVSGWLREGRSSGPAVPDVPGETSDEESYGRGEFRLALAGIGLSGFVAMLYEVVWTRLLALTLGSSTHAFSIMLITFITGIAVGAWWVGRWKRLRRPLTAFGWAELALAATMAGSMWFYYYLPYGFAKLAGMLVRREDTYPLYEFLQAATCFTIMLAPTICLGVTLPLVSRIATAELARTGRSVGAVFSINTVGTVLGAALTGLWLMPTLGLAPTLMLGIGINTAIGLAILGRKHWPERRGWILAGSAAGLVLLLVAGDRLDFLWRKAFTLGLWRRPEPPASLAQFRQEIKDNRITYYRDGAGATVSLHPGLVREEDGREGLSLRVNGKVDASTGSDTLTQLLLGHLPPLLHPKPSQVLVIGLGSGMTCGAALRHPEIQQLDVVEILPEVVEAARLFGGFNDQALNNPRLRLTVEDAKTFLQVTRQPYDLIISEPSNPWMAGVAGVFSREYYEICRDHLRPGGLMAQWVQIYETSDQILQMVLATFTSVFPYLDIWLGFQGDLIMVGSTEPWQVDLAQLEKRFSVPPVKEGLARIKISRLPVLLSQEIVSIQNSLFLVPPDSPQHSDYYPTLPYLAQRAFFTRSKPSFLLNYNENFSPRPTTLLGRYLERNRLTEEDYKAYALFHNQHQLPDAPLYRTVLYRWRSEAPESILPLNHLAELNYPRPGDELESLAMIPSHELILNNVTNAPVLARTYALDLMRTYMSRRSVFYKPPAAELQAALERLIETDLLFRRIYLLYLAELAWDRGDDAVCLRLGFQALNRETVGAGPINFDLDPAAPGRVLVCMIESLWRSGRIADANRLCQQAEASGYVGPLNRLPNPVLEMVCRKVAFVAHQSAPEPAGTPGEEKSSGSQ